MNPRDTGSTGSASVFDEPKDPEFGNPEDSDQQVKEKQEEPVTEYFKTQNADEPEKSEYERSGKQNEPQTVNSEEQEKQEAEDSEKQEQPEAGDSEKQEQSEAEDSEKQEQSETEDSEKLEKSEPKNPAAHNKKAVSSAAPDTDTQNGRHSGTVRKKRSSIVKLIVLSCAAALLIGYILYGRRYRSVFLPSTYINGTAVGDTTAASYERSVSEELASWALEVTFPDQTTETVSASDIDLEYSPGGEVASYIARQNTMSWLPGLLGYRHDITYEPTVIYDYQKLLAVMADWPELDEGSVTKTRNAYLDFDDTGHLTLIPEVDGNDLNIENVKLAIRGAIKNISSTLDLGEIEGIEIKPTVFSDDSTLNACLKDMNSFLDTAITLNMSDGTTKTLDSETLSSWLIRQSDGTYTITDQMIANKTGAWIAALAEEDDNYGHLRVFHSTNFGTVKLKTEALHGHTMDQAAMDSAITDALRNRTSKTVNMQYTDYEDSGEAVNGNTYLEVDIDNQTVYYYLNGELAEEWPVVTGRVGSRSTPYGIYELERKLSDTVLVGKKNANGVPSYRSHVDYFNQFFPSYGFHDASWRSDSEFGGTTYIYYGSHGCINMPLEGARYIYEHVDLNTPVVVFSNDNLETTVLHYHEARNYTAECQTHDDIDSDSAEEDESPDLSPDES